MVFHSIELKTVSLRNESADVIATRGDVSRACFNDWFPKFHKSLHRLTKQLLNVMAVLAI
eukprot:1257412-Amphidinium_carterae.1